MARISERWRGFRRGEDERLATFAWCWFRASLVQALLYLRVADQRFLSAMLPRRGVRDVRAAFVFVRLQRRLPHLYHLRCAGIAAAVPCPFCTTKRLV